MSTANPLYWEVTLRGTAVSASFTLTYSTSSFTPQVSFTIPPPTPRVPALSPSIEEEEPPRMDTQERMRAFFRDLARKVPQALAFLKRACEDGQIVGDAYNLNTPGKGRCIISWIMYLLHEDDPLAPQLDFTERNFVENAVWSVALGDTPDTNARLRVLYDALLDILYERPQLAVLDF